MILRGDARDRLREVESGVAHVCVTSPPYFWLRDYGHPGQIGLEPTVDEYVEALLAVFEQVARILVPSGTLWLNLGDTYNAYNANRGPSRSISARRDLSRPDAERGLTDPTAKNKDLLGVPWRVALALRDRQGWYLRSPVVWRRNRPERVTDRPRQAYEHVFQLTRSQRGVVFHQNQPGADTNVWDLGGRADTDHSAAYPFELPERCVLLSSNPGDVVLDPFSGSGTTRDAALALGRGFIGCELTVGGRMNIEALA